MRSIIREKLEQRKQELTMPESSGINLTKDQLQELLLAVASQINKLNPLEQKKYDEELRKEHRRLVRAANEGYTADLQRWAKQNGCSHSRWPSGHRDAGNNSPRGQGEWCTGGQVHSDGTISLICIRCTTTWKWKATMQEIEYAQNAEHGLLGFAPPPIERCLNQEDFIQERPVPPSFKDCEQCGEKYSEKFGHKCSKTA